MQATPNAVLLAGRIGRWQWPWALLGSGLMVALAFGLVGAGGWVEGRLARGLRRSRSDEQALIPGHLEDFAGFALFGIALVAAAALVLLLLHRQDPRRAISPDRHFDWRLFAKTAFAYFLVLLFGTVVDYAMDPGSYKLMPRTWSHVPWLLLGALVILPQAFGEDYVFKGYLTRVWGAVIPVRLVLIPLVAGLFTSGHLVNDDMKTDLVFNVIGFITSEILALVIFVRTGSLAATTGYHWMNNVYTFCLVSTHPGQSDALSLVRATDTLVLAGKSHLYDPMSWVAMVVGLSLLAGLLFWHRSPFYLEPYTPTEVTPVPSPM